jgi:hypothetical protein
MPLALKMLKVNVGGYGFSRIGALLPDPDPDLAQHGQDSDPQHRYS